MLTPSLSQPGPVVQRKIEQKPRHEVTNAKAEFRHIPRFGGQRICIEPEGRFEVIVMRPEKRGSFIWGQISNLSPDFAEQGGRRC
jgi:hypothetical protein